MKSDKGAFRWFRRGFVITLPAFVMVVLLLLPQLGLGQDDAPSNGGLGLPPRPGSAPPADLIIENPEGDISAAIAEAVGIDVAELSSPLVIPAAAFIDTGFEAGDQFRFSGYLYSEDGSRVCPSWPIYLPDGVTITSITGWGLDNSASELEFIVWRLNNGAGTFDLVAAATSSGASSAVTTFSDLDIGVPVVDNTAYSYYGYACVSDTSSAHKFHTIQVHYVE